MYIADYITLSLQKYRVVHASLTVIRKYGRAFVQLAIEVA